MYSRRLRVGIIAVMSGSIAAMATKNGNSGNSGNNGDDDKGENLTPYQALTAEFVVAVLTGTGLQEANAGGDVLVKACAELAEQVLALESPEDIDELPEELPEEPTAL